MPTDSQRNFGIAERSATSHQISDAMAKLIDEFASHGIVLSVQKKQVIHINFRMTQAALKVSAPKHVRDQILTDAIRAKIDWAIRCHRALMMEQAHYETLWGEYLDVAEWLTIHHKELPTHTLERLKQLSKQALITWIYQDEIRRRMPSLLAKWQPKLGKQASAIRLRKMSSRWGSCNTLSAKITLNTHLASYPLGCLEYVLVHELCHLHHANHSADFWRSVENAMPDYQYWHGLLKKSKR
ncbi:YgjP-like metallopeptidase domain-containing protein [Moraxella canis]|uniref:YgjP-like metallopeptidase domain-containing protein n=1 Tax=Moraxella canis TaxID=90239 RepID=A0ABZ0WWF4_9GAMM|nr:YgjP-like metallopeptidase domain-containing protein [Moraxella canis]WQE03389.1 YgjP-like metallopeptidase domain-containing protein [Moraxella canis]